MKKIIFAVIAACTLTLLSLSGSAQTIIENREVFGLDQIKIIQAENGDLYHYYGSRDSTHIAKIVGNSLDYILRVGGNNFQYSNVVISTDGDIIYFSIEGKICSIKTDGSNEGVYRVVFEENGSIIVPIATDTYDQWIVFMKQNKTNQKLLTVGLYTLNIHQANHHIISSSTGVVIGNYGFRGSNFFFSGVGRYNSTIYDYDAFTRRLNILSQDGISEHGGTPKLNTFYYAEQDYRADSVTIYRKRGGSVDLTYKIPQIYPSAFYDGFEGPDGEWIVQGENSTVFFDFNQDVSGIWDKPYPPKSTKWSGNYFWTSQNADLPFEDAHINLYKSTNGVREVVATMPGFSYVKVFIKMDKAYTIFSNQSQTDLQLVSFDLNCPEYLTITQSMVDNGQTLFKARHISIQGIINIPSDVDIVILAGNNIEMGPTSGFNVETGGSVEIRPFACPN